MQFSSIYRKKKVLLQTIPKFGREKEEFNKEDEDEFQILFEAISQPFKIYSPF